MGAFLHADAIMVATLDVNGKSNEIHAFAPLLDQIADLAGVVVTGDALCRRRHKASYEDVRVMPTSFLQGRGWRRCPGRRGRHNHRPDQRCPSSIRGEGRT
jgi:hypothetical protein